MAGSWTSAGVDLHLELPSGRGRRAALEQALRDAIRDGRLGAGARMPSSRALAGELGLARGTVVEAYSQLLAEGYLRARPGAVTEVADAPGVRPRPGVEPTPPRLAADFRLGRPDLSAFPRQEWLRGLRQALQVTPDAELGPPDPRGSARLRSVLADYLGRARGVVTAPELIVICSGFAQGLRLVCDALATSGGRAVALEDPCLPDHRATVAATGLDVVALAVDEAGARPDAVAAADTDAIVLTPAHQAPLGGTLARDRRAAFIHLAAQHDTYIIEDDYDGEFRYDRHPVGALQGLAPERVVYAGSASKSLAPGLRLGWLALPTALLEPVVEAKRRADRGSDVLTQLALAQLIETGLLDRHIRRMRLRYRRRRDALVATLAKCAPAMSLHGIAAGLHAVALLPSGAGVCEDDVLAAARERSIALTGLQPFWHRAGAQGLVLGYGTPPEHEYARDLGRLGRLLKTLA
jgi:GntR family transcriptional regulator/MocR family aminotransferase